MVAFRARSVTLNFKISKASPDVSPGNIQWTFQSQGLQGMSQINSTIDHRYQFTSNRISLTISNLFRNDSGKYTLTARNVAGIHFASINLIVEGMPINTLIIIGLENIIILHKCPLLSYSTT